MRQRSWAGLVVGVFVGASCGSTTSNLDVTGDEMVSTTAVATTVPQTIDDEIGIDPIVEYTCGSSFTRETVWSLEPNTGADIVGLAERAGVSYGLPAAWSELPTDAPNLRIFLDPERLAEVRTPETNRAEVYWVQAYESDEIIFNGPCFPDGAESVATDYAVTEISSCSVARPDSPIGGHTLQWDGSEGNGGSVELLRNGEKLATFIPGEPDAATVLTRRITEVDMLDPSMEEELFDPGSIIYADFEPPVGIPLTYELISLDPSGELVSGSVCGTVTVPTQYPPTVCSVVAEPFPVVSIEQLGNYLIPRFFRNGEEIPRPPPTINGPAADLSAPVGVPLTYEVVIRNMSDEEVQRTICGTVTISSDVGVAERVRTMRDSSRSGPHWYSTIHPICGDCDPDAELTMYWGFREDDFPLQNIWRNRDETQPTGELWETPPVYVPDLLLAAIEEGSDVVVEFSDDGASIVQWSIDGVGVQILCQWVTTAPLDIQGDPFCPETKE